MEGGGGDILHSRDAVMRADACALRPWAFLSRAALSVFSCVFQIIHLDLIASRLSEERICRVESFGLGRWLLVVGRLVGWILYSFSFFCDFFLV